MFSSPISIVKGCQLRNIYRKSKQSRRIWAWTIFYTHDVPAAQSHLWSWPSPQPWFHQYWGLTFDPTVCSQLSADILGPVEQRGLRYWSHHMRHSLQGKTKILLIFMTEEWYRNWSYEPYGHFKPGTFFVSSIILKAKHDLTSKAASRQERSFGIIAGRTCDNRKRTLKNVLLDQSLNTKNNKASDAVSKRHEQLQRDHDIARTSYFRSGRHISFR